MTTFAGLKSVAVRLAALIALCALTTAAQAQTCTPGTPRTDTGAGFTPFGAAEQAFARGGNSGPAWEWAVGTDTEGGEKTQGSLDWVSGKLYAWTVINSGAGAETLEIRDAGNLVMSLTYPSGMDAGNALEIEVSTNPSIGPQTTIAASIATINGLAAAGALSQAGNGSQAAQAMWWFFPGMTGGYTATGTVSLTYPANLPSGSRVQFKVRAGTIPCAGGNTPPTVSISAPAAGALFNAPATIAVTADAQDSDGNVAQVAFFANGNPIGTATSSPFTIQWAGVASGAYSLTAVATDDGGAQTTSAALALTVNALPTVSITSPADGAVFQPPASIELAASATDAEGAVASVQFFADGNPVGTATSSPFGVQWTGVAAGTYSLTALATDANGASSLSAPVAIRVNAHPAVTLTSPAAGASFTAPATVALAAAASDTDGTIAKVEFFHGTSLIATLTSAPYSYDWAGVGAGSYSVSAVVTDSDGATATSAAATITVTAAQAKLYFIHVDHLNTPRLVADETQKTVWRWEQDEPFGANPANTDPDGDTIAFDLPLRLPGQRYDAESGLHYNYFRDYDPSLGRYGESDPIGLAGGINTYVYGQHSRQCPAHS